jgi:adenine deaminase
MKVSGKLIDIYKNDIYPVMIWIKDGFIDRIEKSDTSEDQFICPGLIDAHIHIESSMLTPGSFAVTAVSRGTVAVVSDPHEIANVLGMDGVRFMIDDSKKVPMKFCFGAPSCVPATPFETSGAVINSTAIDELLAMKEIKYLAEMMNFPGVLNEDAEVQKKIRSAKKHNKPVDGHAPGLTGEKLKKYISAGITTDHECTSLLEAQEKISLGMKILIREGSAAANLDDLKNLIRTNPSEIMLCSDDLHPEMLEKRHINKVVSRLVKEGFDLFDIIRCCTLNPVLHYKLDVGLLQPGQPADFIVVDDYREMNVLETWINGKKVAGKNKTLFSYYGAEPANKFNCSEINNSDICVRPGGKKLLVIEASEGDLFTHKILIDIGSDKYVVPDIEKDILKIVVKDRYTDMPPAVGFIKGFGLKSGAFAGSVAHDSHNIICIGTNDNDIVNAVNEVIRMNGGLVSVDGRRRYSLPLNIAGIMSDKSSGEVAGQYQLLTEKVKEMGCNMSAPFMTLSFMALLVIPELKMSDKGLFDGVKFSFVPLFSE